MYILYFQFYILILGQGLTEILVICMDSVFCSIKWLGKGDIFLGFSAHSADSALYMTIYGRKLHFRNIRLSFL